MGLPEFQTPTFTVAVLPMFLPAVIALVAENIGHVKSVGQMTATEVDPMIGRALAADGVATTLAGFGGGSATTTYAENIGVMAATRVYSTAAYWIAAAVAIALSLCPKVGAAISAIPPGVLGGATIVLYGLVGVLGVRIWLTNDVDFSKPLNQMTAAIPLIIGIADFTWQAGDLTFTGIALGSIAALLVYHGMRLLEHRSRTDPATRHVEVPPPDLQFQPMRRTWTWTFDLPPDRLWPVLADTNRFNEAMGLPRLHARARRRNQTGRSFAAGRGKAAGFTLEWEEKPYEWIAGRHFRQSRVFTKGPFPPLRPGLRSRARRQRRFARHLRTRMGAA